MAISLVDTLVVLLAGFCTLAVFSFLWKENPLYRLFEHLFIGIAAGFAVIESLKNFLWPNILSPLFGFSVEIFPDGSVSVPYQPMYLCYIVPIIFGLFYYSVYFPRYAWLSKIVIAFILGYSGGLQFEGFFNRIIPQITNSFKPLVVFTNGSFDLLSSFENIFFIFTLLVVLNYFFFSFRREGKTSKKFNSIGRLLLMLCFGAFFGSTVMARMALLTERVDFMLGQWWSSVLYLLGF